MMQTVGETRHGLHRVRRGHRRELKLRLLHQAAAGVQGAARQRGVEVAVDPAGVERGLLRKGQVLVAALGGAENNGEIAEGGERDALIG